MRDQEIIGLYEAYASIYAPQEEVIEETEQLDEVSDQRVNSMIAKRRRQFRRADEGGSAREIHLARKLSRAEDAAQRRTERLNQNQELNREETEIDVFDYILEYLVAEGYADTNENAVVIMANMSEGWKQDITESILDAIGRAVGNVLMPSSKPAAKPTAKPAAAKPAAARSTPSSTNQLPKGPPPGGYGYGFGG